MDRWGRIDILVNNAGIVLPAPAEDCSLDNWRQTITVNLDGVFFGFQACWQTDDHAKKRLHHQHRLHVRAHRQLAVPPLGV
ncbi:SDR family NAD(P)-dependent oxidoreductase [Rhizobium sp.]|uniref:SDR family NAD(P)-dependent oxidoreductase n=1 Tax=Rhizobium sp. TaxID=391 RepID=UPI002AA88D05